jgi:hypothetical protein
MRASLTLAAISGSPWETLAMVLPSKVLVKLVVYQDKRKGRFSQQEWCLNMS